MQIMNWGILLLLVLIMPFFLGMLPVKYMNRLQKTPAMTYICGWFVSFSLFEVVAIPFILLEKSFTVLVFVYSAVLIAALIISLWRGKDIFNAPEWKSNSIFSKEASFAERIGWIAAGILIFLQMAAAVLLEYYDGDDAYYIATAVMTDTFDTMYLRDNYTGYKYSLDIRHALSPTPIYQAWLSRISGIHPAVIAHSVLSAVWLFLMYLIYGQIANRLFPKKREYRPLFMIFIAIWFAFGNISLYTAETFAMTRTWQGKGLMAGIILPALFLCFMYLADDKPQPGTWALFEMVIISAVFATSISFMLIPTVVGVASILIAIQKKKICAVWQVFVWCLPCLALGVCYLIF